MRFPRSAHSTVSLPPSTLSPTMAPTVNILDYPLHRAKSCDRCVKGGLLCLSHKEEKPEGPPAQACFHCARRHQSCEGK